MKSVLEKWKAVPDYEGLYEVSDYGAIRSLYGGKVKYLRNAKLQTGYCQITLCRDGKPKKFKVHRLVWECFVGTIPEGYEIDHVNTIRDDNRLANLRIVTRKGNMANPISVERHREAVKRRSKDPQWLEAVREANRKARNKPVLQLDKATGEVIREWECAADAARELSINFRNISLCCSGKRKSAGGFKWKFA